jgi:hypothetical protein
MKQETRTALAEVLLGSELSMGEIEKLVFEYKEFFRHTAYIAFEKFANDNMSKTENNNLTKNLEKINRYYKSGIMKHFLYPKVVNPYSREAFEFTGHNCLKVKQHKGLDSKFLFSSKRLEEISIK